MDLSFPVSGLSGTDHGQPERNWYRYRGQQVVRRPPIGPVTATEAQSFNRQKFSQFSGEWATLTESEREAWEMWARSRFDGVTGFPKYSGGRQAYVGISWWREVMNIFAGAAVPSSRAYSLQLSNLSVTEMLVGERWDLSVDVFAPAGVGWRFGILGSWHALGPARSARKTDMCWWGILSQGQGVIQGSGSQVGNVSENTFQRYVIEVGDIIELWFYGLSDTGWPWGLRKMSTVVV